MSEFSSFRHILFSPHPDDIALSLGMMVLSEFMSNPRVLLVSVFDRGRFLKSGFAELEKATWTRVNEDIQYASKVGVTRVSLSLDDATARGYGIEEIFSFDRSDEDPYSKDVEKALHAFIQHFDPKETFFWIPCGFGNHIDHVLLRDCAYRILFQRNTNIVLYEDLPYVYESSNKEIRRIRDLMKLDTCSIRPFGKEMMSEKLRLLEVYDSQIGNYEMNAVREYGERIAEHGLYAERFWIRRNIPK